MVTAATHGAVDPSALREQGFEPAHVLDFSSNQAPLGPAPGVVDAVASAAIDAYPDPRATAFCAAAAERHGVQPDCVVAGNGSTELIRLIAQLVLTPGQSAVSLAPSFGEYEVATLLAGASFVEVRLEPGGEAESPSCPWSALSDALAGDDVRLCWLCSPGNPTGLALDPAVTAGLVRAHPGIVFVLDEAYCDLLRAAQWSRELLACGNLVVLRSMTKAWGLAGLRLGYALAAPPTTAALRAAVPPWSVNACAQAAGLAAFADPAHHERSVRMLQVERDRLRRELAGDGWQVAGSSAGFFLLRVGDAAATRHALLLEGCLVRDCTSFGMPGHIRLSPRLPQHNDRLVAALRKVRVSAGPS
jgi:threonine-phosphate decarboxylase